jgi:hypothetical protein
MSNQTNATREWVNDRFNPILITANTTAVNNARYIANGTLTVSDIVSPVAGSNFEVTVSGGSVTIDSVAYTEGTTVKRVFHSGAWQTYVYTNTTPLQVAVTSNINTSRNWSGRTIILNNDAGTRTITVNGELNTQGIKTNNGTINFVQGAGRTLVNVYGTASMDGLAGSFFSVISVGTTDYLTIDNV